MSEDTEWSRVLAKDEERKERKKEQTEPIDKRSLYERLQEQKAKEEEEFMEKLKNKPAALGAEDIQYFEELEQNKRIRESQIEKDEKDLIENFKRQKKMIKDEKPMIKDEKPVIKDEKPNQPIASAHKVDLSKKRLNLGIVPKKK